MGRHDDPGGVLPESPGCGADARRAVRDGRRLLYALAQWRHEEVRRTGNQVFRSRESAISRSAAGNGVMASTSIACCCSSDAELKFPPGSPFCFLTFSCLQRSTSVQGMSVHVGWRLQKK